jgi:hypothetical protein
MGDLDKFVRRDDKTPEKTPATPALGYRRQPTTVDEIAGMGLPWAQTPAQQPLGQGQPLPPILPSITPFSNLTSTPAVIEKQDNQRGLFDAAKDVGRAMLPGDPRRLAPIVTTPFPLPGFGERRSVLQRVDDLISPIEETVLASIGLTLDASGMALVLNKIPGEAFSSFQERNRQSREFILDALKYRIENPTDWFNSDNANKLREDLKSVNVDRPFIESLIADIATAGAGLPKTAARLSTSLAKAARSAPDVARVVKEGFDVPKIEPKVPSEVIDKVTTSLKTVTTDVAERARIVREKAGEAVGRQFGEQTELLEAGVPSAEAFPQSLAAMRGRRIPEADPSKSLRELADISDGEMDELVDLARTFDDTPAEALNNQRALFQLLDPEKIGTAGQLGIQPDQLRRLEAIYGTDFIDEVIRIHKLGPTVADKILDAINIPRALISSFDYSAMLRQGRLLGNRNPKEFKDATKAMVKATANEKNAQNITDSIYRDPRRYWGDSDLLKLSGIEITQRAGRATKLADREEMFMSSFARRIPWVRVAERSHSTFLNKLRADVFYRTVDDWRAAGKNPFINPDPITGINPQFHKELKQLGSYINVATGRGPMPTKMLRQGSPLLNAVFFSPRLNTARIAAPFALTQKGARGMAAKDLAAFVGTNVALLTLADMSGMMDVNLDPRSADFGKARVGPTRIDPWAGFQQYAVFVARLQQQAVTTGRGEQISADTLDLVQRFMRYKLAPGPGLGISLMAGEDPLGRALDAQRQGTELVTPLAIQSFIEGIQNDGIRGGLLAAPEFIGLSVQSYQTQQGLAEKISFELHGMPFNELKTQEEISEVMNSSQMVKFQEKQDRDRGDKAKDPQAALRDGMALYQERSNYLDVNFKRDILEAGVTGKSKREAIQKFKLARYEAFQATVPPQARELLTQRRGAQTLKSLQDEYWSIEPETRVTNGVPVLDFEKRDRARELVIKRATASGIPAADVKARSEDRFSDPQVKEAIEEYEREMEVLSSYFRIARDVIDDDDMFREYQTLPESQWSRRLKRKVDGPRGVTKRRSDMRRRSKNVDRLLLKWGFVTKSIRERRR